MNKAVVAGAVIVLIVIVVAGAYLVSSGKSALSNTTSVPANPSTTTVAISNNTYCTYGHICGNPNNACAAQGAIYNCPNEPVNSTTSVPASAAYTVNLEGSATVGNYLANATDFTLYTFGGDVAYSNVSACTSTCASQWPPFYASNLSVSPGLNASAFGTITRTGGEEQLTYKGLPLYLFVGDTKPGQISGNGVGDFKVATK